MTDEPDASIAVALKTLVDRGPLHRFAEDLVLPWHEAGLPPFGAMSCRIEPGEQCHPDKHNQDEIAFIYRGVGEVTVGHQVLPVRQGQVVFIPRKAEHVFSNTDAETEFAFFSVWWPRIEPQD